MLNYAPELKSKCMCAIVCWRRKLIPPGTKNVADESNKNKNNIDNQDILNDPLHTHMYAVTKSALMCV